MRYLLMFSMMLLVACASTDYGTLSHESHSSPAVRNLTSYAWSLIGTPYKYGGRSPSTGFDCSGFVDHVFRHVAKKSLPRESRQISRYGLKVKQSQLREGDLVFYNTNDQPFSHVGIYLGKNRFIHAPSSGGSVRVENMNLSYWKKHYNGARRINL